MLREFRGGAFEDNEDVYYLIHLDDSFTRTRIDTDRLDAIYRMYWAPRTHTTLVDTYEPGVYLSGMGPPPTLEQLNVSHITGGSLNFASPDILLPSTSAYIDLALPVGERTLVPLDPEGRPGSRWPDQLRHRVYFHAWDTSPSQLYLIDFDAVDREPALLVDFGDAWVADLRFPDSPFL
jgi:hypothetical protein